MDMENNAGLLQGNLITGSACLNAASACRIENGISLALNLLQ